jgi:hypothetical protein
VLNPYSLASNKHQPRNQNSIFFFKQEKYPLRSNLRKYLEQISLLLKKKNPAEENNVTVAAHQGETK